MSGGRFNYLYGKEVTAIVQDSDTIDDIESMEEELKHYGAQGEPARAFSSQLRVDILKLRAQIDAQVEQLEQRLNQVREVFRMVEYHCFNDVEIDSVQKELDMFNQVMKAKD